MVGEPSIMRIATSFSPVKPKYTASGRNRAGHTGCYAGSFSADQHGILYPQYQYKEISSAVLFIGQTDEGEQ